MQPPVLTFMEWFAAALDPVLLGVAFYLGWRADQIGKVFIAALVALVIAVLVSWLVTYLGIPWIAPVGRDLPMLLPVRSLTALFVSAIAYVTRHCLKR